jgi:hypothetical protein
MLYGQLKEYRVPAPAKTQQHLREPCPICLRVPSPLLSYPLAPTLSKFDLPCTAALEGKYSLILPGLNNALPRDQASPALNID